MDWGKLNGSPTAPAFPQPTFAQIAAKNLPSTKKVLISCHDCGKKFYTQHGLACHVCTNKPPSMGVKEEPKVSGATQPQKVALDQHSRAIHREKAQRLELPGDKTVDQKHTDSDTQIVEKKAENQEPAKKVTQVIEAPTPRKKKEVWIQRYPKSGAPNVCVGPSTSNTHERLHLSISGNVLQASFPIAAIVPCPFHNCKQNFASGDWSNAVPTIRAHLSGAHAIRCTKTYHFCVKCASGFFEQSREHPCLKDAFILETAPPHPFGCFFCKEVFASQNDLSKHVSAFHSSPTSSKPDDSSVADEFVERSVKVKESIPPPPAEGVDLLEDSIRYFFPLPQTIRCPVSKCSHSFTTKKWYTTNTSLKRHLTSFHRRPNLLVQFWCLACSKRIVQPARHRCLKGASLVVSSSQGEWQCEECQLKATTKIGLDNHAKAHRSEVAVAALPQLSIPTSISNRRKKRQAKLDPISSGDPGGARHAPPASPQAIAPATQENEDEVRGRADVAIPTVLDCFNEALDTLLEVDEISERFPHFENLVEGITEVIQKHFNLVRPQTNQDVSLATRKVADPNNPQVVQRSYRWNRRKCIRQITHANSSRCPLPRDEIFSHFEQVWETSSVQGKLNHVEAPVRPPIVKSLARDFVLECLKSCENSAPGPDMISYKHWGEIDPNCIDLQYLPQAVRCPKHVEKIQYDFNTEMSRTFLVV
ncbi:c2H2-type domain-containing protein [Trichonephila clavata]|uniref:C2H2-type domain-containing protein n=1 Tax=Trichonephila clavata TaxID=2740835 RepID=A0A8X6K6E7_TRICU|nr:c2H2-type domain-containing protein [Trichonephila clavata]